MRVTCANCRAEYQLEEQRIPPGGALVQCIRCRHVFTAARPLQEPASARPDATLIFGGGRGPAPTINASQTLIFGRAGPVSPAPLAPIGGEGQGEGREEPEDDLEKQLRSALGRRRRRALIVLAVICVAAVTAGYRLLAR